MMWKRSRKLNSAGLVSQPAGRVSTCRYRRNVTRTNDQGQTDQEAHEGFLRTIFTCSNRCRSGKPASETWSLSSSKFHRCRLRLCCPDYGWPAPRQQPSLTARKTLSHLVLESIGNRAPGRMLLQETRHRWWSGECGPGNPLHFDAATRATPTRRMAYRKNTAIPHNGTNSKRRTGKVS